MFFEGKEFINIECVEIPDLFINDKEEVGIKTEEYYISGELNSIEIELEKKSCNKLKYWIEKQVIPNNKRKMLGIPKISRRLYK